ncbi:MAG TPA: LacI family DNA-binding transcriptional regulator [Bryobacteraceae bacterium]|nr:LacI family DNA-binding transcriptional regulator [Bryobacteraceae bacterium]
MKKVAISIKDIARKADVSHSTVSRALRNSPLVNRETAERIRKIAKESDFRVSAIGRSLATGRTNTLGAVATTIEDPFVAEVLSGAEDAANAHGYSLILANSKANPDRELKVVHSFEERRVDGIIVLDSRVGSVYIPMLARMKVPIVLINSQHPGEFVHSISIDNVAASQMATRYLVHLGHTRIAYLGKRGGYQSDAERAAGYRQALEAAGIPERPELMVYGDGKPESGRNAMDQLLSLAEIPTAVFCYNDLLAIGALSAIRQNGLLVPDDVSIVGFDDLEIASYTHPPLTTIRQPKHQMGRAATEMLLNLLQESIASSVRKVQGELIVRESAAPPKSRA